VAPNANPPVAGALVSAAGAEVPPNENPPPVAGAGALASGAGAGVPPNENPLVMRIITQPNQNKITVRSAIKLTSIRRSRCFSICSRRWSAAK